MKFGRYERKKKKEKKYKISKLIDKLIHIFVLNRYRSDKEVNHRSCSKWVDGKGFFILRLNSKFSYLKKQ